jgi:hypothetical protein
MINLNLTPKETVILFGFLEGVLEVVAEKPSMDLIDKENTTTLLKSIMGKIETELVANTIKSSLLETIESATKMVAEEKYV